MAATAAPVVAEEDTELRDLLVQTLENSGVLNRIKVGREAGSLAEGTATGPRGLGGRRAPPGAGGALGWPPERGRGRGRGPVSGSFQVPGSLLPGAADCRGGGEAARSRNRLPDAVGLAGAIAGAGLRRRGTLGTPTSPGCGPAAAPVRRRHCPAGLRLGFRWCGRRPCNLRVCLSCQENGLEAVFVPLPFYILKAELRAAVFLALEEQEKIEV